MSATIVAAAAAAALFRVVPLACGDGRLALAGGAVLRLADGASCASVRSGRALAIALDGDGRATPRPLAPGARPASEIPRAAFVIAPTATEDQREIVTVVVEVAAPPRTPPNDDLYLSTERSGWSPSEIRMDRVDARHFRLALRLRRGARLAFRVTRGNAATIERDATRALPPAHVVVAEPGARIAVDVAAWADVG